MIEEYVSSQLMIKEQKLTCYYSIFNINNMNLNIDDLNFFFLPTLII